MQKEIIILIRCSNENIVKLYAVYDDSENINLLTEFFPGKTLFYHLVQKSRLDEAETRQLMIPIIQSVAYLHSQNPPILHWDLKPENILYFQGKVKIIDFGWSSENNDFRNTYCGTIDYLSPEMILGTGHNEKLDIWTLGILMYELLYGRPPFSPRIKSKDQNLNQKITQ